MCKLTRLKVKQGIGRKNAENAFFVKILYYAEYIRLMIIE